MFGPEPLEPLTVPCRALVAGALLLDAPIDPGSALGRLGLPERRDLDREGLCRDGRLAPWFASLVEVVAWPALAAEVVRQDAAGGQTRTLVWAHPEAAVLGRPAGDRITIEPVATRSIAGRLVEACALPPEPEPGLAHPCLVADLLVALLADDAVGTAAALDRMSMIDSPDLPRVTDLLTTEPATWRIETAWTDADGHQGGRIAGLDTGPLGAWEISGTAPALDAHPTSSAGVGRRVGELLPIRATDVMPGPRRPADRAEGHR